MERSKRAFRDVTNKRTSNNNDLNTSKAKQQRLISRNLIPLNSTTNDDDDFGCNYKMSHVKEKFKTSRTPNNSCLSLITSTLSPLSTSLAPSTKKFKSNKQPMTRTTINSRQTSDLEDSMSIGSIESDDVFLSETINSRSIISVRSQSFSGSGRKRLNATSSKRSRKEINLDMKNMLDELQKEQQRIESHRLIEDL
ncbi:unnamed protein product [Didymodactylos carnosus]|uniref:Uncharacterized protein n=1 Tax=Didymodactylos carnosus TaxID=1234261 RepID=A0A813YI06_9BILA|nr:unnamed protein product [Didymodactylos carnosus]CAF3670096.1 unnamed protein product [Didymodactylos carnosus]